MGDSQHQAAAAGWTVLSASGAVVLLIGGWLLAGALQPASYDWVRDTISVLAGFRAHDRWLMSIAFVGIGLCHLVTAAGARAVGGSGRATLGLAGVATAALAGVPLPAYGRSAAHTVVATVSFVALALWPVLGVRRDGPHVLRPAVAGAATVVMLGLLGWFVFGDPATSGLAERAGTTAQAVWPLIVVLALRAGGSSLSRA